MEPISDSTRHRKSLTEQAQDKIAQVLRPGDWAIDGTVGNANDTFFLADQVGPQGQVIGFDIQELAIHRATAVLGEGQLLGRCRLLQRSHHQMRDWLPMNWIGEVRAIMFNLGYLPRGDKSIITHPETTLPALEAGLEIIAPGGRITVVAYTGHEGGMDETLAIRNWLRQVSPSEFETELLLPSQEVEGAPELYVITRLG